MFCVIVKNCCAIQPIFQSEVITLYRREASFAITLTFSLVFTTFMISDQSMQATLLKFTELFTIATSFVSKIGSPKQPEAFVIHFPKISSVTNDNINRKVFFIYKN